jgi:hypothetical protein
MIMKTVLAVIFFSLLSVGVSAQLTPKPRDQYSDQLNIVFPDSLSAEQVYKQFGVALVQNGFNTDSREASFGLLLASIRDPGEGILSNGRNRFELRCVVVKNVVLITADIVTAQQTYRFDFGSRGDPAWDRREKLIKVLDALPGARVEFAVVNQKAAY